MASVDSGKIKSAIEVYSINFVGKMYLPLLNALYENLKDNMYITRKYNKYLEIIN